MVLWKVSVLSKLNLVRVSGEIFALFLKYGVCVENKLPYF